MSSFADFHDALADAIEAQLTAYSVEVTDSYPRWGDQAVTLPTAALVLVAVAHRKRRTGEAAVMDLQFAIILFGETEHEMEGMAEAITRWLRTATITVDSVDYRVIMASAARHENTNDIEAEDHAFDFILQINGVT